MPNRWTVRTDGGHDTPTHYGHALDQYVLQGGVTRAWCDSIELAQEMVDRENAKLPPERYSVRKYRSTPAGWVLEDSGCLVSASGLTETQAIAVVNLLNEMEVVE